MTCHAPATGLKAVLLSIAVLLLQAGCGAGMGGTGTGDAPVPGLSDFGATAAPVCLTPLAASLGCSSATAPGAAASEWVDMATGGRLRVRFAADGVALRDDCAARRFEGDWGTTPTGAARYWGSTLADGAVRREAASLAVVPDGAELLVQLLAEDGRPLGTAVPLRRVRAGDPAPAACPG